MAAAEGFRDYIDRRIDNFTLDDILWESAKKDTACYELFKVMADIYSDQYRHKNEQPVELSRKGVQAFERWIAILTTENEWPLQSDFGKPWLVRFIGRIRYIFSDLISSSSPLANPFWPFDSDDKMGSRE